MKKQHLIYFIIAHLFLIFFFLAPLKYHTNFKDNILIKFSFNSIALLYRGIGRWAFFTTAQGRFYQNYFEYDGKKFIHREFPRLKSDAIALELGNFTEQHMEMAKLYTINQNPSNSQWLCRYYELPENKDLLFELKKVYLQSDIFTSLESDSKELYLPQSLKKLPLVKKTSKSFYTQTLYYFRCP
ncbi:MAG: hypothetical protein CME62_03970 [Halobacteriovoraceae bacterium]|nr:hypothetical protein [Halobacteriovoraceae bacterium]|tara:strand:- start:17267 stop:17821 length:555 start_codon:yes stop_codon:yes gene_type:complete